MDEEAEYVEFLLQQAEAEPEQVAQQESAPEDEQRVAAKDVSQEAVGAAKCFEDADGGRSLEDGDEEPAHCGAACHDEHEDDDDEEVEVEQGEPFED